MDNLKIIDILVIEDNCNDIKLIAKIINTEN